MIIKDPQLEKEFRELANNFITHSLIISRCVDAAQCEKSDYYAWLKDEQARKLFCFNVCINSQGIYYHRGCKKLAFDEAMQAIEKCDIPDEIDLASDDESSDCDRQGSIIKRSSILYIDKSTASM